MHYGSKKSKFAVLSLSHFAFWFTLLFVAASEKCQNVEGVASKQHQAAVGLISSDNFSQVKILRNIFIMQIAFDCFCCRIQRKIRILYALQHQQDHIHYTCCVRDRLGN